jgi:DNA-directed RNA polymerase beta' subunit
MVHIKAENRRRDDAQSRRKGWSVETIFYVKPRKRAHQVVDTLKKTVREYEENPKITRMPYTEWKEIAIDVIAEAMEEAEEAIHQQYRIKQVKDKVYKLILMMIAVGCATVAFWSGFLVLGRLVNGG